jgi:hypothetical protein
MVSLHLQSPKIFQTREQRDVDKGYLLEREFPSETSIDHESILVQSVMSLTTELFASPCFVS